MKRKILLPALCIVLSLTSCGGNSSLADLKYENLEGEEAQALKYEINGAMQSKESKSLELSGDLNYKTYLLNGETVYNDKGEIISFTPIDFTNLGEVQSELALSFKAGLEIIEGRPHAYVNVEAGKSSLNLAFIYETDTFAYFLLELNSDYTSDTTQIKLNKKYRINVEMSQGGIPSDLTDIGDIFKDFNFGALEDFKIGVSEEGNVRFGLEDNSTGNLTFNLYFDSSLSLLEGEFYMLNALRAYLPTENPGEMHLSNTPIEVSSHAYVEYDRFSMPEFKEEDYRLVDPNDQTDLDFFMSILNFFESLGLDLKNFITLK